jgi:hypothetical protein
MQRHGGWSRALLVVGLAFLTTWWASAPARANTTLQGTATITGGWTDNPTGVVADQASDDFFLEVRPGLRLTSMQRRIVFYAGYTFDATLYLRDSGATGYSNSADLGFVAETSKTTTFGVTATFLQSSLNNVQVLMPSTGTMIMPLPGGTSLFYNARASESFNWDIAPLWHFAQALGFNAFFPDDVTLGQTYEATNDLTLLRNWKHDSGALLLKVDFVDYFGGVLPTGMVAPDQPQILETVRFSWLHDFGAYFSSEVALGAIAATSLVGNATLVEPVGRIGLYYRFNFAGIDLVYEHGVTPNVFTASTFLTDSVTLRGSLPLGRPELGLSTSAGYMHGVLWDSTSGQLTGGVDTFLADLSLTYNPWPELGVFARYQFMDELGNASGPMATASLLRNTVLVGVNIVYPARAAAPYGFRASVRADRADEMRLFQPSSPVGAQPSAPTTTSGPSPGTGGPVAPSGSSN